MVEWEVAKLALLASIGGEGLVFQPLKVYELGLVYVDVVKRLTIGGANAVLRDNLTNGTGVEGDDVFPTFGHDQWLRPTEGARGAVADVPMYATVIAPVFPMLEHTGQRVGLGPDCGGADEGGRAAGHLLKVAQVEVGVKHGLTCTTAGHDYVGVGINGAHLALHAVEVDFLFHNYIKG